jgi:hypothetical protein
MNRLCPAETRLKEGANAHDSDQNRWECSLAAGWWRPVSALPAVSRDYRFDVKRGDVGEAPAPATASQSHLSTSSPDGIIPPLRVRIPTSRRTATGWRTCRMNRVALKSTQPFPGPGPRQLVSTDGGTGPAWSRDGRELFYTTTQMFGGQAAFTKMMAVAVGLRPPFTAAAPHMFFQGKYGGSGTIRSYDVTADGRRFLMVQQKERPPVSASEMILVQNWLEELKARVPTK